MPAQLVALNDGPNILLDKPILLLGRHPECDIQIDSRKISRRHCCIAQVSDYLVVRDLGSTNGVRINGVRVTEGRLNAGDEVTIGNHRYQVTWDANLIPAPVPPVRPAVKPAAPPPAELRHSEDFLESSDDPVPLAEPGGRPNRPAERPFKTPPKPDRARGESPPARAADSLILPDHFDLSPSDVLPSKEG
jgi:predicted component of type VI protein secretion system